MASATARGLTKLSFRRDVRLFLIVLVSFYAVIIFFLLFLLLDDVDSAEDTFHTQQAEAADAATLEIRDALQSGEPLDAQLVAIRARHGFEAVEVRTPGAAPRINGRTAPTFDYLERTIGTTKIRYSFDAAAIDAMRRRFYRTAVVCTLAAVGGVVLLMLYLPHILRPIEALLDEARALEKHDESENETSYLIETFRKSIATLKSQEVELRRLHELERTRADDLETITSTLTRSLTSGLIAFGPDDRLLDVNNAGREILDIDASRDVAGTTLAEIAGDTEFTRVLGDALATRNPLSRREVVADASKVIGVTTVPLTNAASSFMGTLALFTELTQMRRLESRVRELQTLADLGVMSAGIAHEFRNSLSTILGLLKLARRNALAPEVDAKLRASEEEAHQLAAAVAGFLQFARPMPLQLDDVDLRELIEPLVQRFRESENLAIAFDAESATVRADAAMLSRAFENILRNAVEATAANDGGREIAVRIRNDEEPLIEIADNGPGMNAEEAAHAFLPFHSTKPSGTGLGLPLARKIILLHGGTIALLGQPDGGTLVRVELGGVSTEAPQ